MVIVTLHEDSEKTVWKGQSYPLLFVSIYPITDEDILMIGSQSANCSWVLAWCGFSWVVSPTDPSVAHGRGAVAAKAAI